MFTFQCALIQFFVSGLPQVLQDKVATCRHLGLKTGQHQGGGEILCYQGRTGASKIHLQLLPVMHRDDCRATRQRQAGLPGQTESGCREDGVEEGQMYRRFRGQAVEPQHHQLHRAIREVVAVKATVPGVELLEKV